METVDDCNSPLKLPTDYFSMIAFLLIHYHLINYHFMSNTVKNGRNIGFCNWQLTINLVREKRWLCYLPLILMGWINHTYFQ